MKYIVYSFLSRIQFKIESYLYDKGYYDNGLVTLDEEFWRGYE